MRRWTPTTADQDQGVAPLRTLLAAAPAALAAGITLAWLLPAAAGRLEPLLLPVLALLLFTAFTRITWRELRPAADGRRFLGVLGIIHGAAIPLLVAALVLPLAADVTVRVTLLLVLLAPSTWWFATFAHGGGGSVQQATLALPVLLAGQLLLVPPWLVVLAGGAGRAAVATDEVLVILAAIILAPLALAMLLGTLARSVRGVAPVHRYAPRCTAPLAIAAVFLLAAGHGRAWLDQLPQLAMAAGICATYAVAAPLLSVAAARPLGLSAVAGRTLLFSIAARNGVVVLPFALTLPEPALATGILVAQAFIELGLLRLHARLAAVLLPDHPFAPWNRE